MRIIIEIILLLPLFYLLYRGFRWAFRPRIKTDEPPMPIGLIEFYEQQLRDIDRDIRRTDKERENDCN